MGLLPQQGLSPRRAVMRSRQGGLEDFKGVQLSVQLGEPLHGVSVGGRQGRSLLAILLMVSQSPFTACELMMQCA